MVALVTVIPILVVLLIKQISLVLRHMAMLPQILLLVTGVVVVEEPVQHLAEQTIEMVEPV